MLLLKQIIKIKSFERYFEIKNHQAPWEDLVTETVTNRDQDHSYRLKTIFYVE
jgi:hypothetical protein